MNNILYLSYDGMTDPLGQSQVLPYIIGLTEAGYQFDLISFEKKDRFDKNKRLIQDICDRYGIAWHPLPFSTRPPFLSKWWDVRQMRRKAVALHKEKNFQMTHCRSYISAGIGVQLKKQFGVKFFFDMRGFWVDERVDGGLWNIRNPFFKAAYNYYKKKEAEYIKHSDWIISLTEAGKNEIESWKSYEGAPISVIPCSADLELFQPTNQVDKQASKNTLQISQNSFVLSYLGSIGTWYLLDEMLDFFVLLKEQYPNAVFLFITPEDREKILNSARKKGISEKDIITRFAQRNEVPYLMKASDVSIFFIKPAYSKIASSPTKLGELFALGIPVIANSNVGDVKAIINRSKSGFVIHSFNNQEYTRAIQAISGLLELHPNWIREQNVSYYDLQNAIQQYREAYAQLL